MKSFSPSKEIQDAWKVVKHLKTKGIFFLISTSDFSVMVWKYGDKKEVLVLKCVEDTLSFDEIPLAICRCALAAIGVDVDG